MSYDLAVWKRGTAAPTLPPADVYAAVYDDRAHPAIGRFDVTAFETDVRTAFGEANPEGDEADDAVLREACDFAGAAANWVVFTLGYGQVGRVLPRLLEIAADHGLVVYDPQRDAVLVG